MLLKYGGDDRLFIISIQLFPGDFFYLTYFVNEMMFQRNEGRTYGIYILSHIYPCICLLALSFTGSIDLSNATNYVRIIN